MRFKAGDRVRIKSLYWYEKNKDEYGYVDCGKCLMNFENSRLCGKIVTISRINAVTGTYKIEEDNGCYNWTDEMIEGLVEDEKKPKFKIGDKVMLGPYPCKITDAQWKDDYGFVYTVRGTDFGKTVREYELVFDERKLPNNSEIIQLIKNDWNNFKDRYDIPDDYHFVDKNGNEINISEIVLEKKKKEYPKTFEECVHVLEGDSRMSLEQMNTFRKLIDARNAYWKIAGEEIGLGKSWKPDWDAKDNHFYTIHTFNGKVECSATAHRNAVLIFPTEEIRDAFYEAFKKEIEICKELL